ncbi:MAG: 30S ribosomal protein S1 [Epsilonproteobacteria bacterium]|nr:30S ribosomal protein S1 [Campylobacterota bacterium]
MSNKDLELGNSEENFEELLNKSFEEEEKSGNIVEGVIVKIDEGEGKASIDVNKKNEAQISIEQLKDENGELEFKEGDKIPVMIMGFRGEVPIVSYTKAKKQLALEEFLKEYDDENEYIVEGEIVGFNKGGYIVDCDGMEFFLPNKKSFFKNRDKKSLIGKKVRALIIKVDKDKKSVVISRKDLIERERKELEEKVQKLIEAKKVKGRVKKITSYGLFVEVDGIDGLVHFSEISHKGPVNPAKYFQEGDEVEVVVKEYDPKKRRLSLSIKDAKPNPWDRIDELLAEGDSVKAVVSNIESYGAFVDLGDELEAFLHVSEISWDKNVKDPHDYLKVGDEINVEVIEIDKEKKRLRVSQKRLLPKPIEEFAKKHKPKDIVKGKVTSITNFGAFVNLEGNIEGLLHNSEVSWKKDAKASDLLKVGDEIEVAILKIDTENGKVALSRKALEESPIEKFAKEHKVGDVVEGKVKDKKDFGVFIELNDELEALVRKEDLYPLKMDEINIGDPIKGVIVHLDPKNNRVRVSVRKLKRQEEREALKNINSNDKITLGDIIKEK